MSRMYVLSNEISSFTGPKTVFEISAAADKVLRIHAVSLSQGTSETDDSTIVRLGRYTASGTGTPVTANVEAVDKGDSAYGGVAEDDHSSDISTGEEILLREGISMLAGFGKIWTPEQRPLIRGGEFFAMQITIALTSVTLVYNCEFEEIG